MAAVVAAWTGAPAEPAGARAESVATLAAEDGRVVATIRRTGYGVPHIRAKNFESLAFGLAWIRTLLPARGDGVHLKCLTALVT